MPQSTLPMPPTTQITQTTRQSVPVAAIDMRDVTKVFGDFKAVDHLNLTVQQGEIFGLLGPNGSGKTTTINMISGLSVPTGGEVHVLGYDVRQQARQMRQLLGMVPQETALYEELTAWTNMDFHADIFGIARKEKKERITHMLELMQLLDRKNSRVGTFSGGMKRRLALGRALLHDPMLIYLDEPTLGVDVQSRRALWDYILWLREQGKTVLITTNYLEEAKVLCDRLAIIDHGKLVVLETPQKLIYRYGATIIVVRLALVPDSIPFDRSCLLKLLGVKTVQVAQTMEQITLTIEAQGGDNVMTSVFKELVPQYEILDISQREATLDEVFLNLTGRTLRDQHTTMLSLSQTAKRGNR